MKTQIIFLASIIFGPSWVYALDLSDFSDLKEPIQISKSCKERPDIGGNNDVSFHCFFDENRTDYAPLVFTKDLENCVALHEAKDGVKILEMKNENSLVQVVVEFGKKTKYIIKALSNERSCAYAINEKVEAINEITNIWY
jgi:hypothetical protein